MKEENSYEQFEILFGDELKSGDRVKQLCKYNNQTSFINWTNCLFIFITALNLKLDDILNNARETQQQDVKSTSSEDNLIFDWIPTDVPENLV